MDSGDQMSAKYITDLSASTIIYINNYSIFIRLLPSFSFSSQIEYKYLKYQ